MGVGVGGFAVYVVSGVSVGRADRRKQGGDRASCIVDRGWWISGCGSVQTAMLDAYVGCACPRARGAWMSVPVPIQSQVEQTCRMVVVLMRKLGRADG